MFRPKYSRRFAGELLASGAGNKSVGSFIAVMVQSFSVEDGGHKWQDFRMSADCSSLTDGPRTYINI